MTAAKLGGDVNANPRLRTAVDKALSIWRVIPLTVQLSVVGGGDDTNMETKIYEGYGPGGTAVMVECLMIMLTVQFHKLDRVLQNVAVIWNGRLCWLFVQQKGLILILLVMKMLLWRPQLKLVRMTVQEDGVSAYTAWEELGAVRDGLRSQD